MLKTLEQLKEENKAAEEVKAKAESESETETEKDENLDDLEEEDDANDDLEDEDLELDEDGNPIEKPLEPWQELESEEGDDEDDDDDKGGVPVKTHIAMKQKLKGKLSDVNEELEALKAENEALKAGTFKTQTTEQEAKLVRPKLEDFDTEADFQAAVDEYEDKKAEARYQRLERVKEMKDQQRKARERLDNAVDNHFDRAAKLVEKAGIDPNIYKKTDLSVREAIESVRAKEGDFITDQLISMLGEGSEKVMYFLGRNKSQLDKVKSLLIDDPSGMSLAIYLGRQKERLTNPKKPKSRAHKPAPNPKGEKGLAKGARGLKRKYDKAHKEGNTQEAYNLKKQARASGVDVSGWV